MKFEIGFLFVLYYGINLLSFLFMIRFVEDNLYLISFIVKMEMGVFDIIYKKGKYGKIIK